MLEVIDLRFGYSESSSWTYNLVAHSGRALAIMGASGVGKSTLLNLIAGFEHPHSGVIRWQGQDLVGLSPAKRGVSLLSQGNHLFEHLTAAQNIDLGMAPNRRAAASEVQARDRAMDELGLSGLQDRVVTELSGGQQQRVALARCLVSPRPLVLLDEPFSALDVQARQDARQALRTLMQHGKTLIFSTHEAEDAQALDAQVYQLS